MSKVLDLTKWVCCMIVVGVLILIALPVMLVVQPFIWCGFKRLNSRYTKFLKQLGGKCFFCYNRNHAKFIERELLPKLPDSIEVIFTDGSILESNYNKRFIFRLLYEIKCNNGFPQIINISDGVIRSKSLGDELRDTVRQNKPVELLLSDVYRFLEKNSNDRKKCDSE